MSRRKLRERLEQGWVEACGLGRCAGVGGIADVFGRADDRGRRAPNVSANPRDAGNVVADTPRAGVDAVAAVAPLAQGPAPITGTAVARAHY